MLGGKGITTLDGKPVPARHGIGLMYRPCGQCGIPAYVAFQESARWRVASSQRVRGDVGAKW